MNVLYISYDGLTDPLGRSQVLPYIVGLAKLGHNIHVLSCEKYPKDSLEISQLAEYLEQSSITWSPLAYHKTPAVLSTVWDIFLMACKATQLHKRYRFDLVHCRSYPSALSGISLKRQGARFIFDIRGFWADEKVDGGSWDRRHRLYNLIYLFFKKVERKLLNKADAVISLTHAAKKEIVRWKLPNLSPEQIYVIPCCVDLEHFDRDQVPADARQLMLESLNLTDNDFVVVYSGSLGDWYLIDQMLLFFKELLAQIPSAKLLFISTESRSTIDAKVRIAGVPFECIRTLAATRKEMPTALSLAHLGLFFRLPAFSAIAVSPTKLAEMLSMGIPVVANAGIGDDEFLSQTYDPGPMVRELSKQGFENALMPLAEYLQRGHHSYRAIASDYFCLLRGVHEFNRAYHEACKLEALPFVP